MKKLLATFLLLFSTTTSYADHSSLAGECFEQDYYEELTLGMTQNYEGYKAFSGEGGILGNTEVWVFGKDNSYLIIVNEGEDYCVFEGGTGAKFFGLSVNL